MSNSAGALDFLRRLGSQVSKKHPRSGRGAPTQERKEKQRVLSLVSENPISTSCVLCPLSSPPERWRRRMSFLMISTYKLTRPTPGGASGADLPHLRNTYPAAASPQTGRPRNEEAGALRPANPQPQTSSRRGQATDGSREAHPDAGKFIVTAGAKRDQALASGRFARWVLGFRF